MSYGHPTEFNNGHGAFSQSEINQILAANGRDSQGNPIGNSTGETYSSPPQQSHSYSAHSEPQPGIQRKDTSTRRDPLTGDLIEEYSGKDENGPAMRAHYNWDKPEQAPNTTGSSYSSGGSYNNNNAAPTSQPRPGEIHRTNTTVSYDAAGNRIEEHDGEGTLRVRALWNDDEDTSGVYNPNSGARPQGPPRHQSSRY